MASIVDLTKQLWKQDEIREQITKQNKKRILLIRVALFSFVSVIIVVAMFPFISGWLLAIIPAILCFSGWKMHHKTENSICELKELETKFKQEAFETFVRTPQESEQNRRRTQQNHVRRSAK